MTTAATIAPRTAGIAATALFYPDAHDPVCPPGPGLFEPDPLHYIVWVRPRPKLNPNELGARLAIHVNHGPNGGPR